MITRRYFLTGLGVSAAGMAPIFSVPNETEAAQRCSMPRPFNGGLVRQCSVGFNIPMNTARQSCDYWCWAACIEAAFRLYDYQISQERIVQKLYHGHAPCLPSIGPQIALAVEGYWEDHHGRGFYETVNTHADLHFGIIDPFALGNASRYLAQEIPVIVGALGHATLLTAMTWIEDNFGRQQLMEMIVRDPWPGNLNRCRLTPMEFQGTSYIAAIIVE